jgi:flavodoxin
LDFKDRKILVVFFSHTGQNYSNGRIVELKKGNTAVVADMISELTVANTFEIRSVKEYPFNYSACTTEAKDELRANLHPGLAEDIDISSYDVIFLGYPNWWGTMPMPVWTFLEKHNFTGKTILPFCTHEGSGMGNSESDIRKLATGAEIKNGLAIHGSSASNAEDNVKNWIMKG